MTAIEKVIAVARGELGYREKKSNAQLDDKTANAGSGNYTKYARDLDAIGFFNGPKQGYPYCAVFFCWLFVRAFGAAMAKRMLFQPDSGNLAAGCEFAAGYYRAKGRLFTSGPQAGDQIFFGPRGSTHTGLVTEVRGGRVYTVEGNSSNGVCERSYALGANNIYGYGRPDWSLVEGDRIEDDPYYDGGVVTVPEAPSLKEVVITLPQLYKGVDNETVRAAQILLAGRGFPCGSMGADGDFGANTKNAVRKYQQMHGMEDDGVIGVNTWTSLLTRK